MSDEVGRGGQGHGSQQSRAKYLTAGAAPGEGPTRAAVTLTVGELEAIVGRAVDAALARGTEALVDRDGLARRLGCSASHIDALRKKGLPTVMVGQSVRFDVSDVVRWLKASGNQAA